MSKNDDLVRRLRVMGDETRRYRLHREYCKTAREAADAIERGAAQGVRVKQLEWKGPFKPGENGSHYDHIYADSALGRYAFEWKSWKVYDSPTSADCPGDFFYAANDLNDAKAAAQADYEQRIMSALDTATPPAPAPDAGEKEICPDCDGSGEYAAWGGECPRCGGLGGIDPTPQPPAVEAEAGLSQWHLDNWTDGDFKNHIPAVRAALKAKTDEIERLREELHRANGIADLSIKHRDTAEASNKALREGLKGTLDAWEMLPEGYHRIHAIQSWLADNMQPAIARARSLLSEKGAAK